MLSRRQPNSRYRPSVDGWLISTRPPDRINAQLAELVRSTAPGLVALDGVGIDTAAILIVAAGDNPQRLRSEAAFAHLCGVAPIEASSGKTVRHRLNRGGNRQANHALWRIVFTRMSDDERTRKYVARRHAEGTTKPKIMRILKRYVAREVYKHLRRSTWERANGHSAPSSLRRRKTSRGSTASSTSAPSCYVPSKRRRGDRWSRGSLWIDAAWLILVRAIGRRWLRS
jgi:Transposase IS116/IS110/IS902 family